MKLCRISISNFFSFGEEVEVSFSGVGKQTLVCGQTQKGEENSNGAGKSSLFEALFWCLTGKTVRGVSATGVIRTGTDFTNVKVELTAVRGGEEVSISVDRYYSSSKKSVVVSFDGKVETFHDSKQATARLFEELGITPELLSLACFYGRCFNTMSAYSPAQRAALIDTVVGGDIWENARKKIGSDLKASEKEYEDGVAAYEVLQGKVMDSKEKEQELVKKLEDKQEECKKRQSEVTQKKKELEKALLSLEKESKELEENWQKEKDKNVKARSVLETIEVKRRGIEKDLDRLVTENKRDEVEVKRLRNLLGEFTERKKTVKSDLDEKLEFLKKKESFADDHSKLEEQVKIARQASESNTCPLCKQAVADDSLEKDLAIKEKELVDAKEAVKSIKEDLKAQAKQSKKDCKEKIESLEGEEKETIEKIKELEKVIESRDTKEQDDLKGKIKELEKEEADAGEVISTGETVVRKKLQEFEVGKDLLQKCQKEISELEKVIESLDPEKNREVVELSVLITTCVEMVDRLLEEEKSKKMWIDDKLGEIELMRFWKVGFKAIRYSLFTGALDYLDSSLNAMCNEQGLEFDAIEVKGEKIASDGRSLPDIEFTIRRGSEKLNLGALSEGETQRFDLACFLSVHALIEHVSNVTLDLAVLDEPMSGIDYDGRDRLFRLFTTLSEKRQVLVIDHDANFKDLFEQRLTVKKEDGVSVVI